MQRATPSPLIETVILSALEETEKKIALLIAERDALRRQLMKAREQNVSLRDVTRRNSAPRILTENRIIDALRRSSRPLTTHQMVVEVRDLYPAMKEVTIRSHLVRMKAKGLILSPSRSFWTIPR